MTKRNKALAWALAALVVFVLWNVLAGGKGDEAPATAPKKRRDARGAKQKGAAGIERLPHLDLTFWEAAQAALNPPATDEEGAPLETPGPAPEASPERPEGPEPLPRNLFVKEPDPARIYQGKLEDARNACDNAVHAMTSAADRLTGLPTSKDWTSLDEVERENVEKEGKALAALGKVLMERFTAATTIREYEKVRTDAAQGEQRASSLTAQVNARLQGIQDQRRREAEAKLPPPLPQIPFEYIGYMGDPRRRIGVFQRKNNSEILLLYSGAKIDNLFTIKDLGYDSCLVGYEGRTEETRIPLLGAAK